MIIFNNQWSSFNLIDFSLKLFDYLLNKSINLSIFVYKPKENQAESMSKKLIKCLISK